MEPTTEPTVCPTLQPTKPSQQPTTVEIVVVRSSISSNSVVEREVIISITAVMSVAFLCILCICFILYKRSNNKPQQRRPTGNIMFNTVYAKDPDHEEFNNDFRERLQSVSPIRLATRMTSVIPPEQEILNNNQIMRILFQDVEEGFPETKDNDNVDKTLIKEPEILNDDFIYENDDEFSPEPNPKNSMRYISSSNINTCFYEDIDIDPDV
jgi:hypothetical protein